ncbi:MAG: cupredoxin domain-containing protein [Actinomycetota bacterium]
MREKVAVVALAVVASFAIAAPASPRDVDATPAAATGPFAQYWGYATPVLVVEKGGSLTYTNLDIIRHDLVHDVETDGFGGPKRMLWCEKSGGDGHHHDHGAACPVFWSKQIGLNGSATVLGLKNLKPGTIYTFFCTLHHGMRGTLIAR